MRAYSVVVPIFRDAYLAEKCVERLHAAMEPLVETKFPGRPFDDAVEIILIVDGLQSDFDVVSELPSRWPAVKVIYLSRNFGQHNAISAGFENAKGDTIIRLNVDCQDPPEEIPRLIEALEKSQADQVIGAYETNANPVFRRLTSRLFYKVFNWLSGYTMPLNTAPLRVMTRRYIDAYNALPERNRFPQSLDEHLGFGKIYVPIKHQSRTDKKSSYTPGMRLRLAVGAAVGFSDRPMYVLIKMGMLVFVAASIFMLYLVYRYIFVVEPISGFTTIVVLLTIFSSSIYVAIGMLGLYIADVQREVKTRPYYLIRDRINF